MDPEQINLVRASFERAKRDADGFASVFYARFFAIDPTTRPLFPTDLLEQRAKLMATLGDIVDGLDDTGPVIAELGDLGRRHVGYGVSERHYASLGSALVWTLEQTAGIDMPPETRAAWFAAYGVLSVAMIAGARRGAMVSVP